MPRSVCLESRAEICGRARIAHNGHSNSPTPAGRTCLGVWRLEGGIRWIGAVVWIAARVHGCGRSRPCKQARQQGPYHRWCDDVLLLPGGALSLARSSLRSRRERASSASWAPRRAPWSGNHANRFNKQIRSTRPSTAHSISSIHPKSRQAIGRCCLGVGVGCWSETSEDGKCVGHHSIYKWTVDNVLNPVGSIYWVGAALIFVCVPPMPESTAVNRSMRRIIV